MFGKKKRKIAEQQQQIESLTAELERLTGENRAFQDRIADIERRESGIGRAISEASLAADKMLEDAQRKAGALLEQTQTDCDAVRRDAEIMVDDAYRNARDIVKEAEETGQKKLDEVDQTIGQYATLLNAYDKLVQEQIQMAHDSAKRFAELSEALHRTVPELLSADGTLAMPAPEEQESASEPVREPEPEEAPAPENVPEPAEQSEQAPEDVPEIETEEPVADSGEGTPLMRDVLSDYEEHPFPFDRKEESEPTEERVWTVDEIAKTEDEQRDAHVDAIIDDILRASAERNRE